MRPITIDKSDLKVKIQEYISKTKIPILVEFCYQYPISKSYLYALADEDEELKDSIKLLITKKEASLERETLDGNVDKTMAIFSLKQLGWKDKSEVEQTIVDKTKMAKELENTFE